MPRRRSRKRDRGAEHVPLNVDAVMRGWVRTETSSDGREWKVRALTGGDRAYRCPGCDHPVAPGTPHLVAWPADHLLGDRAGLDDRRHWHTSCWPHGRGSGAW